MCALKATSPLVELHRRRHLKPARRWLERCLADWFRGAVLDPRRVDL